MSSQHGLFDPPVLDPVETKRQADLGQAKVQANTTDEWSEEIGFAIVRAARKHQTLTTDQVWEEVPPDVMDENNASGLGPCMKAAARMRIIERTDNRRDSIRPATHGRPLRVWRSLVFVS